MKKLYRKGAVHPSSPSSIEDQLSVLSVALLTLTASLSPQDKEVLAYLISCTNNTFSYNNTNTRDDHHHVMFNCHCFSCYTSYWARWDASPNRQVIHEIIEAFEDDDSMSTKKNKKTRKKKKDKKKKRNSGSCVLELSDGRQQLSGEPANTSEDVVVMDGDGVDGEDAVVAEKGSLRKFMSLICEKVWSVWGHHKVVGDQGK